MKKPFTGAFFTGLILLAWGCAGPPTPADRMLSQSAATQELAEKWHQGNQLVLEGEKKKQQGQKLVEKGKKEIKEGERMISKGKRIMQESESTFRERFTPESQDESRHGISP